jgi:hypothetical protein
MPWGHFSRNPGELFPPFRPALSAGFFSPRYRDLGRPPELAQSGRLLPWRAIPGPRTGPLRPRSVARVSRPGRPGSVTFNQAAVRQLPHAINLLIQLSSGFAGLLPGARNSGRAPWCVFAYTCKHRARRLALGSRSLVRAPSSLVLAARPAARAPWCTDRGPFPPGKNRGPGTRVQKTGRVASCAGLGPISHAKCCPKQNWAPLSGQL